jgi:2,4-dienoyl-CoA reductase-like NADH-dependent reductase (Old Yellow Enzyme family)
MKSDMMLFEPFEFSGMKLKNRVVSVPVVSNLATEDGFVTDDLIERYRRIAAGGTGWIITEDVVVLSRRSPYNLSIWDDKFIPGLKQLTDTIHEVEGVKIGIQLGHFLKIAMSGWRQKVEDLTKDRELHDSFHVLVPFRKQTEGRVRWKTREPHEARNGDLPWDTGGFGE